jgi:hypothetical protein
MDDLENIIYIILVAISLISGAWKNISKQKEIKKEKPSNPASEARDQMERTFREVIFDRKNEAAEAQKPGLKLKEMEKAALLAKQNRRLRKRNLLEDETNALTITEEPKHSIASTFDAKQAVIYSEILNPPYL